MPVQGCNGIALPFLLFMFCCIILNCILFVSALNTSNMHGINKIKYTVINRLHPKTDTEWPENDLWPQRILRFIVYSASKMDVLVTFYVF